MIWYEFQQRTWHNFSLVSFHILIYCWTYFKYIGSPGRFYSHLFSMLCMSASFSHSVCLGLIRYFTIKLVYVFSYFGYIISSFCTYFHYFVFSFERVRQIPLQAFDFVLIGVSAQHSKRCLVRTTRQSRRCLFTEEVFVIYQKSMAFVHS